MTKTVSDCGGFKPIGYIKPTKTKKVAKKSTTKKDTKKK